MREVLEVITTIIFIALLALGISKIIDIYKANPLIAECEELLTRDARCKLIAVPVNKSDIEEK